jgi:transcriptional regulator with XRE-family HTH domain
MAGIGEILRTVRQQSRLSLREVEERSLRFAEEKGNRSYQISASWLDRLEREQHELTTNKLIVLADIYNLPPEQLLRSAYPENERSLIMQLSSPNATMLLPEGPLQDRVGYLLRDTLGTNQLPDETTLLGTENGPSLKPYRRGIIGKRDLTPGSHDPGRLDCSNRYSAARDLSEERLDP